MRDRDDEIMQTLAEAKKLARRYRMLTGKPLGVTGEVAEFEAAGILGLKLTEARTAGYDAIRSENGTPFRLQINGRCILPGSKPGQWIGSIDIDKEFDAVLLVLMDEALDATAIYEADRVSVIAALTAPGSIARNDRGALGVAKFKSIGKCVWKRTSATT